MFPDTIEIEISQDDINTGVESDCKECPSAIAISRFFNDKYRINVYSTSTYISSDNGTIQYLHPYELIHFIRCFDSFEEVYPGKYTLVKVVRNDATSEDSN